MRALVSLTSGLVAMLALCACGAGADDGTRSAPSSATGSIWSPRRRSRSSSAPSRRRRVQAGDAARATRRGTPRAPRWPRPQSARDRPRARLAELVRGPRPERIAEARARLRGGGPARHRRARSRPRAQAAGAGRPGERNGWIASRRRLRRGARRARRGPGSLEELLEGTTDEELAQARGRALGGGGALADARIRRERLRVRAPRAGWVDALPYELGERPPPGGVVAVMLADAAPYARVYVPGAIRVRVTPGRRAPSGSTASTSAFAGRVRSVSQRRLVHAVLRAHRTRSRTARLRRRRSISSDPGARSPDRGSRRGRLGPVRRARRTGCADDE